MPPSITFRAIQRASKAVADRGLRGAGFRRLGNHLHRHVDGLIHAVHFQASPWGSATAGSFTVNLAVTSPFVYSTWAGGPLPSNPATALFPVMERIGLLMPSGRDQWWDVDGSTDLDALAREVADAVLRHGLPFFEPFRSSDSMLSRLRAGQGLPGLAGLQLHLVHAMLAAEAGDRREAQALLQGALATAGAPPFCEIVRVIGARLGIACDERGVLPSEPLPSTNGGDPPLPGGTLSPAPSRVRPSSLAQRVREASPTSLGSRRSKDHGTGLLARMGRSLDCVFLRSESPATTPRRRRRDA